MIKHGSESGAGMPSEGEQAERRERIRQVAGNIVDAFGFKPGKESFLMITDTGVVESQPELLEAIQKEIESKTSDARTRGSFKMRIISEATRSAADMGEYVGEELRYQRNSPVLLMTSMSRSHSKETATAKRNLPDRGDLNRQLVKTHEALAGSLASLGDELTDEQWGKLEDIAKKTGSRIMSITKGKNPHEILTRGAVEESVEVLRERAEKIRELMRDVNRVRITSPEGTDLVLNIMNETIDVETGDLSKPGSLSNYPAGELECAPSWSGSSGRMIVTGPIGGEHMLDQVQRHGPISLEIKDGEVVSINNLPVSADSENQLVESVKTYLNAGNNSHNDAYRLAELGIGINAKACEGKPPQDWGSTEGEKIYGTVHVAVGSNGSLGVAPNNPDFNAAKVHCDIVLLGDISVDCSRKDGSNFRLIDSGEPVGY